MGKKHGFRGTPVKPSSRLSSTAGVFERRGDPLVSPREGQEDFGRNLETENPDMDQYFAARRVETLRPEQIDTGNAFRKSVTKPNVPTARLRAAQVMQEMHRAHRAAGKQVINIPEEKPTVKRKVKCPFCSLHATDKQISHHLRLPAGSIGACKYKKH